MRQKIKIKSKDPVVVVAGKDRGQKSTVSKVDRSGGKVFVENVNVVKRHMKPNQMNPDGGIVEKEMPIDVSNVMYHCKKCDKGSRLGMKELDSGKKVRFCKRCGEVIDKD